MTTVEWAMLPCWLMLIGMVISMVYFFINDLKSPKGCSGMPRPYPPSEGMILKRKLMEEEKQEQFAEQIAIKVVEKLNG